MKLKYVLGFLAVAASGVIVSAFIWFTSCQGRMQQCYASFREATSDADRMTHERRRAIYSGFGVSRSTAAFPMPLGDGTSGIVLLDRSTSKPRLIASKNYTHWSPHFSSDGERLVFIRQELGSKNQDLLSCNAINWHCYIIFQSNTSISSVSDIGNGAVIFSMNALRAGDKDNMRRFDLFSVRKGQSPVQLTNYETYTMSSISVSANKIAFSAEGIRGFEPDHCADADRFKCDKSDIYVLDIDPVGVTISDKPLTLKPHFVVAGYSVRPTLSGDGKRVAFINTARRGNPWRYNMIVAGLDGVIESEIGVEGFAFSSGAFVDGKLLVNELFDDYYRIRTIDVESKQITDVQFNFPSESLKEIQPVSLSISE